MINRSHRFHGLRSLNFVYKTGKTARGPLFGVRAAANPRRQTWRAAVVISKKVHKSAVARNRMRRRLYAAMRSFDGDIAGPSDIVITVFSEDVLTAGPSELSGQLKKQLKDLKVIN